MANVELIKEIRKTAEKAIGSHLFGIDLEYQIMAIRSIKKYYEQDSNMQAPSDLRDVLEVLDACMDATNTDLADFDEWDLIEALEKNRRRGR